MIPYQFDPILTGDEHQPIHLKVYDPALIPLLLAFVEQTNLDCKPLETNGAFTDYELRCNEGEFIRLDTYLKHHTER